MQLICQHPVQESLVLPHCGKPVIGVLADGDVFCGVIDGVRDGQLMLRPLSGTGAEIAAIRSKISAHPQIKAVVQKADTKAFFPGFFGSPWLWAIPLLFIAALFSFPFFWW